MKKLKYVLSALSLCLSLGAAAQSEIPESPQWDIYPDTWVATDGAGRVMPDNSDVGDYKIGKQHTVGIFYVTWHTTGLFNMKSPYNADVSKVLEKTPTRAWTGTMPRGSRNTTTPTIGENPRWATFSPPTLS